MVRVRAMLAGLVSFLAVFGAFAPGARALQVSEEFSPKARFMRVWGALWYLRSLHSIDDLTLVKGGVDGSTAIAFIDGDSGASRWYFVEGTTGSVMSVSTITGGSSASASIPGYSIDAIRQPDGSTQVIAEKPANARLLTYWLADVYAESGADGVGPIRHLPFLTGNGWADGAATIGEAKAVCSAMNIVLNYASGSPDHYKVAGYKTKFPGELVAGTGTLNVEINVTSASSSTTPLQLGTTPDTPITVVASGDKVSGPMTLANTHIVDLFPAGPSRPQIFFKLPTFASPKAVTVTSVGATNRLVLGGVHRALSGSPLTLLSNLSGGNAVIEDYTPELSFIALTDECFVVVELPTRPLGDVKLKFTW